VLPQSLPLVRSRESLDMPRMHRCLATLQRVALAAAIPVLLAACASEPTRAPPLWRDVTQPNAVAQPVPTPTPVAASRPWSAEATPTAPHAAAPKLAALSQPPAPQPPAPQPQVRAAAPARSVNRASEAGLASYYWQDQMTASGERFDKRAMTAAHRTLPLGTRVRVTHMKSGKSVIVRINDRGPFKPNRIIDLSEAAAEQIEMTKAGLAPVTVEPVN
jgi:rare lipoprotein A